MLLSQMKAAEPVATNIYKPILFKKRYNHAVKVEELAENKKNWRIKEGFDKETVDWAKWHYTYMIFANLPSRYRGKHGERFGDMPEWVDDPVREQARKNWLAAHKQDVIFELCTLDNRQRFWFEQAICFSDDYDEIMEFAVFGGERI